MYSGHIVHNRGKPTKGTRKKEVPFEFNLKIQIKSSYMKIDSIVNGYYDINRQTDALRW